MSATFEANNAITWQHKATAVFAVFREAYSFSCWKNGTADRMPYSSIVFVQCVLALTTALCDWV